MLTHACPIDNHKIDEHVTRLVALIVFCLLITAHLNPFSISLPIIILIFLDFLLRATKNTQYSPLARLSRFILNLLHINPKPIDRAPKLFAARIGLLMSTLLLIFIITSVEPVQLYFIILGFFLLATFLESFFAFCLGCQLYSLLISFRIIKN